MCGGGRCDIDEYCVKYTENIVDVIHGVCAHLVHSKNVSNDTQFSDDVRNEVEGGNQTKKKAKRMKQSRFTAITSC